MILLGTLASAQTEAASMNKIIKQSGSPPRGRFHCLLRHFAPAADSLRPHHRGPDNAISG